MEFPKDTPLWVEALLTGIEDKVERELSAADTSEMAMKASGGMKLWREIKEEIDYEYKKQLNDVKQRNERLNARESN